MTQQEIEALKGRLDDSYMETMGASLHCDLVDALERLAILEAAVATRSFDELPELGSTVILLEGNGDVDFELVEALYDWKSNSKHYVGWRHPVGDLS